METQTGALKAVPFVVHFSAYICFLVSSFNFRNHAEPWLLFILFNEKLVMYFYTHIPVSFSLKCIKLSSKMCSSLGFYYHGPKLSICSPGSDKQQVDIRDTFLITIFIHLVIYNFLSTEIPSIYIKPNVQGMTLLFWQNRLQSTLFNSSLF